MRGEREDRIHAAEVARRLGRCAQRLELIAPSCMPLSVVEAEIALVLSIAADWLRRHHFGDPEAPAGADDGTPDIATEN